MSEAFPAVCYEDHADKRDRWPRETLPAIFNAARAAVHTLAERQKLTRWMHAHGIATAEELHEVVRAAPYVSSKRRECDPIQPVSHTIERGGDCDQWAAVILAALRLLGFESLYLVAVGDALDPYQHACVILHANDRGDPQARYWRLDPKPDQRGVPFNQRSDTYPLEKFFRFTA